VYRLAAADLEFGEILPETPGIVEQEEYEREERIGFSRERIAVENRIRTLGMIRDRIWEGHTHLPGRKDLEFAELMPGPADREPEGGGALEPFRPRVVN
jgi:hypothetical protein